VTHDHEEAFALADRLAVMRAGRVVQSGAIDEVWREPVDEDTALVLGYARVLRAEAAGRVLDAAGLPPAYAVALRRSALVIDAAGPVHGRVQSARVTPDQVRLVVDAAGIGTLDAVAPLGSRVSPGDEVALRVDVTRLAVLPITPGP
jgi:thiamine transport system ATP-binding protein